jgi:hypothetical protein
MRLTVQRGKLPVGAVIAGAALALGAAVRWLHLDSLPIPLCTFRALTGIPCFGCGSTRALGLLGRLDVRGAFLMQPLITTVFLGMAAWGLADLVLLVSGRRALGFECSNREAILLTWGLLVLALLNWVYLVAAGR